MNLSIAFATGFASGNRQHRKAAKDLYERWRKSGKNRWNHTKNAVNAVEQVAAEEPG